MTMGYDYSIVDLRKDGDCPVRELLVYQRAATRKLQFLVDPKARPSSAGARTA